MLNQLKSQFHQISLPRLTAYFIILLGGIFIFSPALFSGQYNGFKLDKSSLIPLNEIHHGGPPKDGIPSIDSPKFITAPEATTLHDNDRVIGISTKSSVKAYPIRILNWHEIVNDGDIVISYCPLCGTGMAFISPNADFGVSGLLYNSDMLLYDRKTESLWSQIFGKAISGPRKGEALELIAVENTSWKNWQDNHPDTLVLSEKTGFFRNYAKSPYGGYESVESLYFPVSHMDRRYHPKEKVIGIKLNGHFKAYPFVELDKSKNNIIIDRIAGSEIEIHFNRQHRSGFIRSAGKTLPTLTSYFHPDTEIYTPK